MKISKSTQKCMTESEKEKFEFAHFVKTVLANPYIPNKPTIKQMEFLLLNNKEALYGGAAGGGKSDALLMAALQYVHVPNYAAILFRRTYKDLSLPGALMDRAHTWLDKTDAHWSDTMKTWTFPSGATLTFAYLASENDKYNYQGSEYQFVGFDELTQFEASQYRYLFSRLRRLKGSTVPIRARVASNPGGRGHEWVKQRFLEEGETKGRIFIPAKLDDNPFLDTAEYEQSLMELDPVTRRQLREGDWDVRADGNKFKRHWFEIVDDFPADSRKVRYWDLAATEPKPGKDPDWTSGAKLAEKDGIYYIVNITKTRSTPKVVEDLIRQTAELDGVETTIHMEQEPGSSGVNTIDHYRRRVLKGFAFYGDKVSGSKEVRANPLSAAAEAGNVKLVRGAWINDFLDEIVGFPNDSAHDDQVDSVSGAFAKLHETKESKYAVKPRVTGRRRS
ncbi:phage terminase large subunit [Peribacillus asahii]|nr:phage terminase large subunit [Peribacillus asahii]USK72670.1 phage terminase large subunit [Peribacillus asahii]